LDAVILDQRMPGLSGAETADRMRTVRGTRELPIVVLASGTSERQHHGDEPASWNAQLQKPARRSILRATLERLILTARGAVVQGSHSPAQRESSDCVPREPGLRILLAEDNKVNRIVATRLLRREGHEVVTAENGEEALRLIEHGPEFDIVLMDVQMPVMDGLEATRRLRANPRWAELPVIALTAHTMKGDRERFLAAGANDHVAKPFRPEELFGALHRWGGQDRAA
jgi:CheY-like chemotaxis protein